MPTTAALMLLGFAVGTLVLASRTHTRESRLMPHARLELFRACAEGAQRCSARTSLRARDLTERWRAAKGAV
jgi:hypothetical protein